MNFEDVNVISLSPAYEYVLERVAAEFEIVEINGLLVPAFEKSVQQPREGGDRRQVQHRRRSDREPEREPDRRRGAGVPVDQTRQHVPENIQGIFDIVIPFHNLNTVAVKQELSEIENWPDMKYKFSDFTAEGKRREVNKISQELRAKQEELVQVNYALDAQKLGFYDPEYVSKNYGDFKDKLNISNGNYLNRLNL